MVILGPFTSSAPPEVTDALAFIAGKVSLIGSGVVKVASPVIEGGADLDLIRGDDYFASLGRAVDFTSDAWPDLTAATVALSAVVSATGAKVIDSHAGEVVKPTADANGPALIRFNVPSSITSTLPPGRRSCRFDVQATVGTAKVTLLLGFITIQGDIGA